MNNLPVPELALLGIAYLSGSLPFCWLLAMAWSRADLRIEGDGNVGAGNLMAVCGRDVGLAGLVLDVLKGALPVMLVLAADEGRIFALLVGAVAVAAHIWPMWLGFRGGRGAAPALGVALALYALAMILLLSLGLVVVLLTRNTVVALLVVMPVIPFIAWAAYGGLLEVLLLISLFLCVGAKDTVDRWQRRAAAARARLAAPQPAVGPANEQTQTR